MSDREKEPEVLEDTDDRPRGAEVEDAPSREPNAGTAEAAEQGGPQGRADEGADESLDESPDDRADRSDARDGSGAGEPDELEALREELRTAEDRHLRLAAEFNNYRRRAETERTQAWGRAQAELVGSLLDPLDDLQRVSDLDEAAASVEALMEGVEMVERKLLRALRDAGAETVDPEPGEPFDPEAMEAMMRVPTEAEDEDDTVEAVLQKGYRFRGHLVRPARVSVRKLQ